MQILQLSLDIVCAQVQHLKAVRGAIDSKTEVSHLPVFISEDEVKHLILQVSSPHCNDLFRSHVGSFQINPHAFKKNTHANGQ